MLHLAAEDLPTFNGRLGARDAELLLSYLTVPYLRIPLVLDFFANPTRIACLAEAGIQQVLDACLFEPGPWRSSEQGTIRSMPSEVPSKDPRSTFSTPLGLLFNELQMAPAGLISALETMLQLACDLDTGKYEAVSASAVLYVIRLVVRVQGFAVAMLLHRDWQSGPTSAPASARFPTPGPVTDEPSASAFTEECATTPPASARTRDFDSKPVGPFWSTYVRGLDPTCAAEAAKIQRFLGRLLSTLDGPILSILRMWLRRALADDKTHEASVVQAHIAFLHANVVDCGFVHGTADVGAGAGAASDNDGRESGSTSAGPSASNGLGACDSINSSAEDGQPHYVRVLDEAAVTSLVSAQVFLTHAYRYDVEAAHTFSTKSDQARARANEKNVDGSLFIPQTEMFDLFTRHRYGILCFMDGASNHVARDRILSIAVKAATRQLAPAKATSAKTPNLRGRWSISRSTWTAHGLGRYHDASEVDPNSPIASTAAASQDYEAWLLASTTKRYQCWGFVVG